MTTLTRSKGTGSVRLQHHSSTGGLINTILERIAGYQADYLRFYFRGYWQAFRQTVMPELIRNIPRRTGNARASVKLTVKGATGIVTSPGAFYTPYIRLSPPVRGVSRVDDLLIALAFDYHKQNSQAAHRYAASRTT